MFRRIFDARQFIVGGHVAGHADHEQIAEALIEHDLRRDPRVGACESRCVRMLTCRQLLLTRGRRVRMLVLLRDVVLVAGLEVGEHSVGGRGGLLPRMGSLTRFGDDGDKARDEEDRDERSMKSVHPDSVSA